jgi:ABC-type Zn uptake system ZnuABC Zn-binding protein ZnuA
VTYHRTWPNLCERFGLEVVGYVEPRPGIPPSPRHTLALMEEMKRQEVRIILVEPYFDLKTPRKIAEQTSSEVIVLLPAVGGEEQVETYFDLFDHDIEMLATALAEDARP